MGGSNRPYDERLLSLIIRMSNGKNRDKFIEKLLLISVSIVRSSGYSKYELNKLLKPLVDAIYEIDGDAR